METSSCPLFLSPPPLTEANGFSVVEGAPNVKELDWGGWKLKPLAAPLVAWGKDWLAPKVTPPFTAGKVGCDCENTLEELLPSKEECEGRLAPSLPRGVAILQRLA